MALNRKYVLPDGGHRYTVLWEHFGRLREVLGCRLVLEPINWKSDVNIPPSTKILGVSIFVFLVGFINLSYVHSQFSFVHQNLKVKLRIIIFSIFLPERILVLEFVLEHLCILALEHFGTKILN